MTKLISLVVISIATLVMTAVASAAERKLVRCSDRQPAKVELACATRNIWHAQGTLQYIIQERSRTLQFVPVDAGELLKLALRERGMLWLLQESRRDKAEATARLPLPFTNDWLTAVRVVQRAWPGSEGWLVACSSSEGGHGLWVPNANGGSPGGWMQYMEGTFEHDFDAAISHARRYGLTLPPPTARSWHNALGQAYAAGWAYGHNRPSGKWTGARC